VTTPGRRARTGIPLLVALATVVIFACTTDTLIGPKDVAVLVIEPDTVVMPVGDTILLEGIATDSRGVKYIGAKITWTSSNTSVVDITTDGHLISKSVGRATVTASAGGQSASAQVTVTPPPTIATSADSVGFAAVARGPLPASQKVVVTNGSSGFLTGLATGSPVYTGPDTGWLYVTNPSSTAPDSIVLSVSLDTFPVGTYTATFPITGTKATNSPHAIKVTLTLTAGSPSAVLKTAGDSQTAVAKTSVTTAPSVTVKDAFGTAIPNVSVTFSTTAGNGSLTGANATTNASGVATLGSWTLDTIAKTDTLTATVAALPAVTFTAVATHAPASQIIKTAGDAQAAPVSTALSTAPSVTVRDQFGNPVSGVTVTFAATAPNGSVTGPTPSTNAQGVATVGSWTLGTLARTDSLSASVSGIGAPAVFTATAAAGTAAAIVKSAGGTTGTVNANVAPAPAVLVTDQFGNPVAGVTVTFAATAANGTVTGGSVGTNAAGLATVGSFKLATTARTDTLTASAGALTPVVFVVTAGPDVPNSATKNGGDGQTAAAGSTLPTNPSVLVKDQFGNAVPGFSVTFAVTTGGGAVTGGNATTNASGIATVGSWQLGNSTGSNSLTATVGALPVLTFTATSVAGTPKNIARLSPASQSDTIGATAGTDSVLVTDQLGNPVSGVTVTWGIGGAGSLTPFSGSTNASGIAKATRILGTTPGTVTDSALATGLTGSPVTFTVTTSAGHGATLVKGAGDTQTDTVGATLPIAYSDTVKDRAGNPVSGVTVTWGVAGGGSITPSSLTGANGVATATRILGTAAGSQTATGTVAGLAGSPTNFSSTATHGNAKNMGIVAGTNNQAAPISTAVAPPPAVKVTDQFGNAVSGVAITFAVAAGGANGNITGATPSSDVTGTATLGSWTLGTTAKPDTVTATAAGLTGSPLTFVDFANAGTAKTIALAGGNGQTDTVGATLPHLDSVLVTDAGTNPVSGVAVTWAVTKGGGSIPPSSTTNANGIATASWTLGDTAEAQTATASVSGLTGSPVTFSATATHGNAKVITINGGDGQSATVNTAVPTAPSALVTDAHGNPVSGVSVTFAVTLGGGSLTGTNPATTNASGIASIGWTLGATAGTNNMTATAGGLTNSPLTYTATGTAGTPTQMTINGGNGQTAQISTLLPTAPSVLVQDAFNNPVSGATVTFAANVGSNGSLTAASPATDLSGIATVGSWTTGSVVKTDTVVASFGGLNATFTATVTPGSASSLAINGGNAQTDTIGSTLGALSVIVKDAGNNPVPGVTVNWAVTAGSATRSPVSSITDASGIASDTVTLGTTTGGVTVQATSGVLTPANFTETVAAGNPTTIVQNGGNGQSATVNTAVATAPSVKVTDRAGNAVPGVGVTFTVAATNGSVTGGSTSTASNGVATVGSWILDSIASHANTLTATAAPGGIAGNPVTFTATGVAGSVSAAKSTLTASNSPITACSTSCTTGGGTASTITVTELDQFGNPVSGGFVLFGTTVGTVNTFSPASGFTNPSGVITSTYSSTKAELKTINASGGTTQTANVTVVHAAVSTSTSNIVATSPITASSGSSKSNVTITLLDAFSNPISGLADTIWISSNTGANTIITEPGLTNANGQSFGAFSTTTAGSPSVFAYINSINAFTSSGTTVTVSPAAASTVTVTNAGFSAQVGSGVATRPTYTVKDAFGNVVPNQSFTISVGGGGTFSPTSGTTNGSGQFTATSWTMGSINADAANGTMSNTAQMTAGSAVGTATDFGIYTWSGYVSALISTGSTCQGCHGWTYANTVGVSSGCGSLPTIILAGNANSSDLYNKLASASPTCGGSQMPLSGTPFNATQLKEVRAWINNGALNN